MSEWIKTAKVGDKVCSVCTWDRLGRGYGHEVGPVAGKTYTIREIGFLAPFEPEKLTIRLEEISNPVCDYNFEVFGQVFSYEPSFAIYRFRPVQPRKTDISVFTALLNATPAHKEA